MIVVFTDFGARGPYVGQVRGVLESHAPGVPVVELMSDAPAFAPRPAGHLLAALVAPFPFGSVFLCVIDPGVGTERDALFLKADERWYVGPDNGLFDVVAARSQSVEAWRIDWRPPQLSESFHGRDLFAPVAAMLARGEAVAATRLGAYPRALDSAGDDLHEIIYVDAFGNAVTGIRATQLVHGAGLRVSAKQLTFARTFGEVAPGEAFWFRNAFGLVEIAVNQGSAAEALGLRVGQKISIA